MRKNLIADGVESTKNTFSAGSFFFKGKLQNLGILLESGFLDRSTRSAMRLHLNYPEFYGENTHPITTQREISVRCLPQLGIESAKCVFGEINDVSTRPWAWTWAGGLSKAARGGRRAAIKPFHKPMHRIPLSIQQFQLGMANA